MKAHQHSIDIARASTCNAGGCNDRRTCGARKLCGAQARGDSRAATVAGGVVALALWTLVFMLVKAAW